MHRITEYMNFEIFCIWKIVSSTPVPLNYAHYHKLFFDLELENFLERHIIWHKAFFFCCTNQSTKNNSENFVKNIENKSNGSEIMM